MNYPYAYDLAPDGLATVFTLPSTPDPDSLLVLWNGQVQRNSYTLVGATLTLIGWTPTAADSLAVYYTSQTGAIPSGAPGGIRFDPEAIANALFILLGRAAYSFASMDRRGHLPQNTVIANQPHLCLVELGANVVQDSTWGLSKYKLEFWILVYIRCDATPGAVPATELNAALKAIAEVMNSSPLGERQTLGGIVENAWIDGEILMNGAILGEQASMKIPIQVLTGV
jgi:hypothetical protein